MAFDRFDLPHVLIEKAPFGSAVWQFAEAHEEEDRVIVTNSHTRVVLHVYEPGTWLHATTYDGQGYPVAVWHSRDAQARLEAARDAVEARMYEPAKR